MKFTCDRERLQHAFQTVATVAPLRSPKPILQNVKVEVRADQATLMATDMEVGIRLTVDGLDVSAPGSAILPAARFGSILRESSDEKLLIESTSQGTTVQGERSKFELAGGNPDEFPSLPEFAESKFHTLSSRLMRELIRRTLFATDQDSSRYALGGVKLEFGEDRIIAVGTDGRRLAKMEGPAVAVEDHGAGEPMTIVPARTMQLIERALTNPDLETHLTARSNDLMVRTDQMVLFSRLLEGRFPAWRDALPDRTGTVHLEMTVGPLYSALRQASVVASDDSRGIDFTFGNGTLTLAGNTAEVGTARVEMPIAYEGEEVTVRLDHRYVADFLKVLEADKQIVVDVVGSEASALFTTDDGYGYVIMPLARD